MSVCFADLVGFTRLGGELEVQELGSVAGRLAGLAGDRAIPPVRLIKTLGDAVMLVSPNPAALVKRRLAWWRTPKLPSCRACAPESRSARPFSARRLLRPLGQPRLTRHRRRAPGQRAVHRTGPRRCAGRISSGRAQATFRLKGIHEPVPLLRARASAERYFETARRSTMKISVALPGIFGGEPAFP
jgi:class 3 adenylate cyclase